MRLLKHLHIRDFAVIEELEISFEAGMTVFTGETGAGKSIIVDALGLVLGDRADSTVIRSQCESTEITAIFDAGKNKNISALLEEQGIQQDDELMLRRVINRDGRSRAYINGSSVPAQLLRDLGERMVDIHGQHAHQSLMKHDVQRDLLDDYARHPALLEQVRSTWSEWSEANAELSRLSGQDQDRDAKLSLLHYQVQELEALNPDPVELVKLTEDHSRLAHASKLQESGQQVLQLLNEDDHSLHNQLHHAIHELQGMLNFDQGLQPLINLLDSAAIQINEGSGELRRYLDNVDIDPARLQAVEERLSALHDTARKHKIKPEELAGHLQSLKTELKALEDNQGRVAALEKQKSCALENYHKSTGKLHDSRCKAAERLGRDIETRLKELGMPGGRFNIDVEASGREVPQREGMDRITFMVSVNPGQALQPMTKVASGGELSRISLAVQVIGSRDKSLPTLIFDEVDSGIGGGVAEIVGKLLHDLALNRQVLCVTHLPQVAAQGDHHMQVSKSTHAQTTLTRVTKLDREERIEEIARMLGGLKITEHSRAHAREMLKAAQ